MIGSYNYLSCTIAEVQIKVIELVSMSIEQRLTGR